MFVILGIVCQQSFEQQPSYTEVNPGQEAHLICKILNKRGRCSWQKGDMVSGPKIKYWLVLPNVQPNLSFQAKCQIEEKRVFLFFSSTGEQKIARFKKTQKS